MNVIFAARMRCVVFLIGLTVNSCTCESPPLRKSIEKLLPLAVTWNFSFFQLSSSTLMWYALPAPWLNRVSVTLNSRPTARPDVGVTFL